MAQNNSKIRKLMFNEISLMVAIIGAVSGIIFWVTSPQHDLEIKITQLESRIENYKEVNSALQNIKDNDLHELHLTTNRIEDSLQDQAKAIARLEALLENIK